MEEASENGKELSYSARASGMNACITHFASIFVYVGQVLIHYFYIIKLSCFLKVSVSWDVMPCSC
jgi:hypothetical protein